jgi:enterobacterial common antigen flippase
MNQDISGKPSNPDGNGVISTSSLQGEHQAVETAKPDKHTYGQILKSSALIGGSSLVNIAIGMVRTKFMAVILGPSGVGLMGLYGSIADLTQSIVGMGINSSGVRQIAEAVGSGDTGRIARTAQVLQRTSIFLGLLGAVFLYGFSARLSVLTFGGDQQANGVALLSLAVFFNLLSAGQGALIQGMRRISDLAKMSILGTLFGTLISIPTVYFLHEDGVVLSLVLVAAMGLVMSWWYRRKIIIPSFPIISSQVGQEQAALLKLGFAFMSSGLMMTGAAYLVRIFIVRNVGFDAAGLYQAAWALGGVYVGFILQAMGTDFYPRLTAIVNDKSECNRIVNEQAHVSLLLAGPGIIATLTLAPLVIFLFYSSKFEGAVELLRWLCLGMTLRVISWPMGFIIVAKNAQKLFFFSELAWTVVYLGLAWICVATFSLNGVGIAFFGSYIFHVLMIYFIVRQLTGFRWSTANIQTSFFYLALIAVVFSSFYVFPSLLTIGIGILATVLSAFYSIRVLVRFIPTDRIPRQVLRLLTWFRLTDSSVGEHQVTKSSPKLMPLNLKWLMFASMIFGAMYICFRWYEDPDGWVAALDFLQRNSKRLCTD